MLFRKTVNLLSFAPVWTSIKTLTDRFYNLMRMHLYDDHLVLVNEELNRINFYSNEDFEEDLDMCIEVGHSNQIVSYFINVNFTFIG